MRQSEYEALEKSIKAQQRRLAEQLESLKSKTIENDIWQPKENETYFYITSAFTIDETTNELTDLDKHTIEAGNCFKTKEDAKEYAEFISYNLRYTRFINENRDKYRRFTIPCGKLVMKEAIDFIDKENFNKYV